MRNDYFSLNPAQQRQVIEQTAAKLNLPVQAVEKDLWVTAILQVLFTLPCAHGLVFKGGTSISKVWNAISRFSEDIDLAIDRSLFDLDGELTKKQVKKLRKVSSMFVREELFGQLCEAIASTPLYGLCEIEAQPDGVGDSTYPEPRIIYVKYASLFSDKIDYILPVVKIEAGARSLLEPTLNVAIKSLVDAALPSITTSLVDVEVRTAVAEKTFLEKCFLLHELFSRGVAVSANRRSRHLYDLHMMMRKGIDKRAVSDDELWNTIHHHRSTLTSISGVDYTPDIRSRIVLTPPAECVEDWKSDYQAMQGSMIYNNPPSFEELLQSMAELEMAFKKQF
ncbi:MAG: nucleotidyl transferase AbiEii/AbiGii toxin family protein [Porphyromonadaceae bacterium]|nr:MAG: nucleotidyl transferase AbiEii/AbiGii toxin family protein [Porphyromonadaceae bacterium]